MQSASCNVEANAPFPKLLESGSDFLVRALGMAVSPTVFLMANLDLVFLAMLAAMLFRPPDLKVFAIDRVLFVLFVALGVLRMLAVRSGFLFSGPVSWPMLGLLLLSFASLLMQPYDAQVWSMFAAKWVVPFACFHIAGPLFAELRSWRKLELLSLAVLGYLCVVSVLFLAGAEAFILPRFIVDESLGIHADRARGPFLQAVANGVSLNILGLIALDCFRRKRLRGVLAALILILLPFSILATKTRAVWLSFAISLLAIPFATDSRRVRRVCWTTLSLGALAIASVLVMGETSNDLCDRLADGSPVEFRAEMYQAGWEMFTEKPFAGWNADDIQTELGKRISSFHPEMYIVHNTYLAVAVEHGLLGLALYGCLVLGLFRLRKLPPGVSGGSIPSRWLWPILLTVYLINASVVVMQYQFVNGVVFTLAGILAAENRNLDPKMQGA